VVLQQGAVGLGDFTTERLNDPAIHALGARIEVITDDNADPAAFTPARAVAALSDGREISVTVEAQLGSPGNPLSSEEHLAKAQACLAFADLAERHEALAQTMANFSAVADVGAAVRALLAS
jgi:2-methylcitrate dehydratase PrpD